MMHLKITIWYRIILLFTVYLFSSQALASCNNACVLERSNCQQSSAEQNTRCDEQFGICTLRCNRHNTMGCVFLGFKNHEGIASREQELNEITGGFVRVTEEDRPNFAGLCRNNNMRCEYVLDWDRTMYSCGGEKREPTRVACCF
ncbi:MAG: hypothetical protein OQL06_09775 [Gammaproteobacteria bacterium]|nr:hypothetical protein [Gammaproteobacteria bacterium]